MRQVTPHPPASPSSPLTHSLPARLMASTQGKIPLAMKIKELILRLTVFEGCNNFSNGRIKPNDYREKEILSKRYDS